MFNMTMMTWAERWCGSDIYRDDLIVTRLQRLLSSSEQMNKMTDEQCYNKVDVMSKDDEQRWWATLMMWLRLLLYDDMSMVTQVYFNCISKLVLLLRLGYLKPFLALSKKTRQGPRCRVGALHINRCRFYLTVVADPKLIQNKDYKIIWCCVLLCYDSWWFKCLWYVNDEVKYVYEIIMKLVE